ncbi:uncharacterized protein METZ01_LOCUS354760, partial [marine metagenome]
AITSIRRPVSVCALACCPTMAQRSRFGSSFSTHVA